MNNRINEAAMLERDRFEQMMHDQVLEYVDELEIRLDRAERSENDWARAGARLRALLAKFVADPTSVSLEELDAARQAEIEALRQHALDGLGVARMARAVVAGVRHADAVGLIRPGRTRIPVAPEPVNPHRGGYGSLGMGARSSTTGKESEY